VIEYEYHTNLVHIQSIANAFAHRGWIAHMVRVMREWTIHIVHCMREGQKFSAAPRHSILTTGTEYIDITGEYGMGARNIDTPKKWQSHCKKNRSIPGSYRKKWIISLSLKKPVTNKCAALLIGTSDLCPTVWRRRADQFECTDSRWISRWKCDK
jgi:hypothetical protein